MACWALNVKFMGFLPPSGLSDPVRKACEKDRCHWGFVVFFYFPFCFYASGFVVFCFFGVDDLCSQSKKEKRIEQIKYGRRGPNIFSKFGEKDG